MPEEISASVARSETGRRGIVSDGNKSAKDGNQIAQDRVKHATPPVVKSPHSVPGR